MISGAPIEKAPLIRVFLCSSVAGAKEPTRAREVVEGLPKDLLLACGIHFNVVIWDDPGRRFLAVVGALGTSKSSPVDASADDALGGAG